MVDSNGYMVFWGHGKFWWIFNYAMNLANYLLAYQPDLGAELPHFQASWNISR